MLSLDAWNSIGRYGGKELWFKLMEIVANRAPQASNTAIELSVCTNKT